MKILEVMRRPLAPRRPPGSRWSLLVELLLRMKPKKALLILNLVPGPLASRTFEEVSNRKKGLTRRFLNG